jgi:hypothetical protein
MRRWLFLCGFLLLLTGCANIRTVVQNVAELHPLNRINAAETQWKAKGLKNYRISVRYVSAWYLQTDTITVRNGIVTEHTATCAVSLLNVDGKCNVVEVDPQTLTVEGLFQQARKLVSMAATSKKSTDPLAGLSFQFDPTYSYPVRIASTPPHLIDADVAWIVETFERRD